MKSILLTLLPLILTQEIKDNGKCTLCHPPSEEWYLSSPLKQTIFESNSGGISHVYDKHTDKIITPNALQINLPPQLTTGMLEYCNQRGITSLLRDLVTEHPLKVGTEEIRSLPTNNNIDSDLTEGNDSNSNSIDWLIQRPDKHWDSNMHWVSPPDEITQDDYLKMLFENGFDQVLNDLGTYLNMDGLVAYQLTFIGVSHCERGYLHHDFEDVQNKAFNIIIPLVCSSSTDTKDTTPELLLQDDTLGLQYGYKYIKNIGIAVGDNAVHATAPCDYEGGEMRMAATVYVADVNEENVEGIIENYTQEYPPVDEEYLLALRGLHWKSDHFSEVVTPSYSHTYTDNDAYTDDEVEEIEPVEDEVEVEYDYSPILTPNLTPHQILPLQWEEDTKIVTPNALQISLPPNLHTTLSTYCQDRGITSTFYDLLYGEQDNKLDVGENEIRNLNGNLDWYIQRTDERWNSNMHWISPADQNTQDDYLNMLLESGFSEVLHDLGTQMNLNGLVAYHLTFIAVSKCTQGYIHSDFQGVNGKAFNIIIPIQTFSDQEELYVQDDTEYEYIASYKYKLNQGIALGDYAYHATAPCDYTEEKGMRLAATVYVADVNAENVERIMVDYTQYYPPVDEEYLMSISGRHWKRDNESSYIRKQ